MKIKVNIESIKYVNEVNTYWKTEDYYELLSRFDFPDAKDVEQKDLIEMLFMAITDFEPTEAASILLDYKLNDQLKKGQIDAISNEMLEDKVAEEYPNPKLHYDLFNINQFLYKAYNGTFPNTEASVINVQLTPKNSHDEITLEVIAKSIASALSDKSIIKRLYSDQLKGKTPFKDLANFIWTLKNKENNSYEILTSRYWIEKEDIDHTEFETEVHLYDDDKKAEKKKPKIAY